MSFFIMGHGRLHSAEVAGGTPYADRVFAGLSDDQMRARPGQGLNSLVWPLWLAITLALGFPFAPLAADAQGTG